MKRWNLNVFCHPLDRVGAARDNISYIQGLLSIDPTNVSYPKQERNACIHLLQQETIEEKYYKQKARIKCAQPHQNPELWQGTLETNGLHNIAWIHICKPVWLIFNLQEMLEFFELP